MALPAGRFVKIATVEYDFYENPSKAAFNGGLQRDFRFWRTYDGQEIDLVEESPDKHPNVPKAFREAYPDAEFYVVNRDNYLDFI